MVNSDYSNWKYDVVTDTIEESWNAKVGRKVSSLGAENCRDKKKEERGRGERERETGRERGGRERGGNFIAYIAMSSSSLYAPYMGHHGNGKEATQDPGIPREDNPSTTVYTRDKDSPQGLVMSRVRTTRDCVAERKLR